MFVNTDMYDLNKVMDAAQRLWPSWGGYENRSTSSSSLTTALTSGEARIFYLQDHAVYEVTELNQSVIDSLDAALTEKEEESERRATRGRSAGTKE
eukprot:11225016-Alexandrium_andersonii.AAC.1